MIRPERYVRIAQLALLALGAIIVTGAAVRLTNSGLGCDDWPRCSDTRLVDVSSKHAAIEQLNRFFTGLVGAAVIAAVLASRWRVPRRADLTRLAWWLVFGVIANAVLGGVSVKVDLHPLAIQGHLLLSMFLIAVGTVLVRRAGEADRAERRRTVGATTHALVVAQFAATWVAIATGTIVTGAGPHAGDETAARLDVAIPTAARVHGIAVVVAIALAVALAWRATRRPAELTALRRSLTRWLVIGLAQAALGYVQYFSDVPALMVGFHVAGATLVMWASTQLLLDTSSPSTDNHVPVERPDLVPDLAV